MSNPFDQLCRALAKLLPEAFLLWLLLPNRPSLRFVTWLDTQNLPFPGQPDRRCDLAFVPLMHDGAEPAIVAEWKRVGLMAPEWLRPNLAVGAAVFAELTDCRELWKTELKEWNMLRSKQVDEWQAEARDEGQILGAYRMALDFGQTAEQARARVLALFGAQATPVLDAWLAQRTTA
jgi:hypothetical protein